MRRIKLPLLLLSLFFISGCIVQPSPTPTPTPVPTVNTPTVVPTSAQIVGNDKDIHGCIASAGYTWCESKNKCLRQWEEACTPSPDQEIQIVLAKKYNKPINEVKVKISKQDGDYVSGSVTFGQGGPGEGGGFLARKLVNVWEVVWDGNGSVDCKKMRQTYGFPDTILKPNYCD